MLQYAFYMYWGDMERMGQSFVSKQLNLLVTHMVIVESGVNLITPRRYYKQVVKYN